MPLPEDGKESDDMRIRFDTIPSIQTDRFAVTMHRARMHRHADAIKTVHINK